MKIKIFYNKKLFFIQIFKTTIPKSEEKQIASLLNLR